MDLPLDIIILIFNYLIVIDQRNWIFCNKQLYQLSNLVKNSELIFIKLMYESKFVHYDENNKLTLNKYEGEKCI